MSANLEESDPNDVLPPHLIRHPYCPGVRYREGIKPFPVTEMDPSFGTCVRNFGRYEYGLIAIATLVPGYIGYSGMRKIKSTPVYMGLGFGLVSGICYAYAYAYSRLCGFMPLHPE